MINFAKIISFVSIIILQSILLPQSKGVEIPFTLLEDEYIKWKPTVKLSGTHPKSPIIFTSKTILETQRESSRLLYNNRTFDSLGIIDYNSIVYNRNYNKLCFSFEYDDELFYFYDGIKLGPFDKLSVTNNCTIAKIGLTEYLLYRGKQKELSENIITYSALSSDSTLYTIEEDSDGKNVLFKNFHPIKKYDRIYDLILSNIDTLPLLYINKGGKQFIEFNGKLTDVFDTVYQVSVSNNYKSWSAFLNIAGEDYIVQDSKKIALADEVYKLCYNQDSSGHLLAIYKYKDEYYTYVMGNKYGPFPNLPEVNFNDDYSTYYIAYIGNNPNETFVLSPIGNYGPFRNPKIVFSSKPDKFFILEKSLQNSYNLYLNNRQIKSGDFSCWVVSYKDTNYVLQEFIDNIPVLKFSDAKEYSLGKIANAITVINDGEHWYGIVENETCGAIVIDGEVTEISNKITAICNNHKIYLSGTDLTGKCITYINTEAEIGENCVLGIDKETEKVVILNCSEDGKLFITTK